MGRVWFTPEQITAASCVRPRFFSAWARTSERLSGSSASRNKPTILQENHSVRPIWLKGDLLPESSSIGRRSISAENSLFRWTIFQG